MVQYNFDARQYTPKYAVGGGLPPGKYKGVIINTHDETTQDGQGRYLAFDLTPIEGPYAGQIQVDRLNLHNKNPKTVEIANNQLSAYCWVTGVFVFQDTQQLCNIPFLFEVRPQKNNPEYTEIGNIFDLNGNEPGKSHVQQQSPPQQQQQAPPQFNPAPSSSGNGNWNTGPAAGAGPGPGPSTGGWPADAAGPSNQPAPNTGGWPNNSGNASPGGGNQGGWQQNPQPNAPGGSPPWGPRQ